MADERHSSRALPRGAHGGHHGGRGVTPSLRTHAVATAVGELAAADRHRLGRALRILDLGGGTGGLAVPLAGAGHTVTVVDPSPDALASLVRRATEAGVADRVVALQGDADTLATDTLADTGSEIGAGGGYDLVCCHGVLDVVDDTAATMEAIVPVLASGGVLSVTVAGRLAAVLARVLAGELVHARAVLTDPDGRWGNGDPMPRRFDVAGLRLLLEKTGLIVEQVHGVRVFGDLVPSGAVDSAADRIAFLELEQAATLDPAHTAVLGGLGATLHALARKA